MQTVKRSVADRTERGRGEQWSTEGTWGEATLCGDSGCMPCQLRSQMSHTKSELGQSYRLRMTVASIQV